MSNKKLQKLLDDLEDAQEDVMRYRRSLTLRVSSLILGAVLTISGITVGSWGSVINVDTGGFAAGGVTLGIIISIIAGLMLGEVLDRRDPRRELKQAQRAYRDYLAEEVS